MTFKHKNMLIVLFGIFCANISKTTTVYHGFWHGLQSKTVNKVRLYFLFLLFLVDHETIHSRLWNFCLIRLKKHHWHNIIHLLDSAEPDIRFVVQIKADVGWSKAESNISLDLHNKSNVRRGSVQQMFYYEEITEWWYRKLSLVWTNT